MFNGIGDLMKQAQQMQEKMAELKKDLESKEITGQSGAGMVQVVMNGRHDVHKVTLDASLLSEEKEIIEDLLAAAVNDAVRRVEEANQQLMSEMTGGMSMPPGFKMPF